MTLESPQILCPYCSAPWSEENLKFEEISFSEGCDTCGFGAQYEVTLDIICHMCGKLMYRKEGINLE